MTILIWSMNFASIAALVIAWKKKWLWLSISATALSSAAFGISLAQLFH